MVIPVILICFAAGFIWLLTLGSVGSNLDRHKSDAIWPCVAMLFCSALVCLTLIKFSFSFLL
jgi:hypothetical protein